MHITNLKILRQHRNQTRQIMYPPVQIEIVHEAEDSGIFEEPLLKQKAQSTEICR